MTATANHIIDPAITTDVKQLQQSLLALANKGGVDAQLIKFCQANLLNDWSSSIKIDIILLTEPKVNDHILAFEKWLPNQLSKDMQTWFDTIHNYTIEHTSPVQISLFHINNYISHKIEEAKPVLQIIFYDAWFLNSAAVETALELTINQTAACMFLTNEPGISIETMCKSSPNYANHRFMNLQETELTLNNLVEDEKLKPKFPLVQLHQYVEYLAQVNTLIGQQLQVKSDLLFGKSIINYKKQLLHERTSNSVSGRASSQFKTHINKITKNISKRIDNQLENLEAACEAVGLIKNNINTFVGFKEVKGSRNITIKIPQTAISYKSESTQHALQAFYEENLKAIQDQFKKIETSIKEQLAENEIHLPAFKKQPKLDDKLIQQPTSDFNFEKPYEKQITKKGIGQLLMDLRTPIFMLMPFMMIAGVFGSLMGGKDVGQIDETVLFNESRHCIAITAIPEASNHAYRVFIEQVDAKRKKGFFDKEISDELLTEPQLSVVSSVIQKANNRQEVIEELDYDFDDRKRIIYLYLTENGDRQYVIDQLFNPALALLHIPGKSGRSMGISGLAKAMSGLSDYRVFIIGGLLALVSWFVVTRKKSMKTELKEAREKEQKRLRLDLRTDMERAIQQSNAKWKSRIQDYLSDYQNALIQFIETEFSKGVDVLKETKIQEANTLQKRINQLKTERRNISGLLSDHQRNASKLLSLLGKISRQVNRTRR